MKLTYENNFRSKREDGRFVSHFAAHMEQIRSYRPKLALPEALAADEFAVWRGKVRSKLIELLCMPEVTEQPPPKLLSSSQRDGYRVQKWELYPNDYEAVPFLMLIPDSASPENKAPAVLCIPGSCCSKEFLCGEELLGNPACSFNKFPERNMMALHMVKNGMIALAFDNPETAECCVGDMMYTSRIHMCFGYLNSGVCYPGISVFEKLRALEFIKTLGYADAERIAVCGHSLGTVPAAALGLISDDVKAVVYNDFVCDPLNRYSSVTEEDEACMDQNSGMWHIIPGLWKWMSYQDILAALAPKPLALNEGGAENHIDAPRCAYRLNNAADKLQVSYYPKYPDGGGIASDRGYTPEGYLLACNVEAADHSFRAEPSLTLLRKCFGL